MEEKDVDAEFKSWQEKVGPDFKSLESALKPVERYALRHRTDVDPFYSLFYLSEQQRLESMNAGGDEEAEAWDVEEIEREKEEEEYRALSEGELLATSLTREEVNQFKSWYLRERMRRQQARRRRDMTGEAWRLTLDSLTGAPFWYNSDTMAAQYQRPKVRVR
jgi:hypothetical protein